MQDKTAADVANNAIDKLANGTDKVFNTLIGGIENVSKVLKNQAPHVWQVLVKKELISGILQISFVIFIAIISFLLCKFLYNKHCKNQEDKKIVSDGYIGTHVVSAILIITNIIFISTIGYDGLMQSLNPEYYAAKSVLDRVLPQKSE